MSDPLTTKPFREPERNVYVFDELTPSEIARRNFINSIRAQQSALQRALELTIKGCQHEIKYDIGGFPNNFRHCAVCNQHLETI